MYLRLIGYLDIAHTMLRVQQEKEREEERDNNNERPVEKKSRTSIL